MQAEAPIEAASVSGLYRSVFGQLEVYKGRPAPTCAFLLSLCVWGSCLCRIWWPHLVDPKVAGACLPLPMLITPRMEEWRRYLLHALWPLESGYLRGFLTSSALLIEGYALEFEVGTPVFLGSLLFVHAASSAAMLYFGLVTCHISLEPALAGLAVFMHRTNPKVHTDGLDVSMKLPWAVEPRWHLWMVFGLLQLIAEDFPTALAAQACGLVSGAVLLLRDPEVWFDIWRGATKRSPKIGDALHLVLLLFALLFMPLSMINLPSDFLNALTTGLALRPSWWTLNVQSSRPLVHLGLEGSVAPHALWLCQLLIAGALPLLLSPWREWMKLYAGGCVLLMMYGMTANDWVYPHIGFITLGYLVWAFWKLPSMQAMKVD